jgi:signal transduction histidine kinase
VSERQSRQHPSRASRLALSSGQARVNVEAPPPASTPRASQGDAFAVVGIGASAGGSEAFTQLLKHLPSDTGMGFVLVQHLDPTHEIKLTQLLARATRMPVEEARNGMRIAPDHVYVIPPNRGLVMDEGRLKLTPRKRLERELLNITERERQRIQHDLHDGLGQQLHGLSYLATLLEKDLQEDTSPRAAKAGQLNKYLHEALDLTRSLAHGLQPVKSVPEGLMTALRELAERTRGFYRVDCRFDCRAPVLIHRQSAANHLYRIAQEAVNNAMKHGQPTRVRIKLAATRQRIILGVRDNGVGIRCKMGGDGGMGLHVMQYRAGALSGSLAVQKLPHGGTEVVCSVTRQALLPEEDNSK